MTLTIRNSSSVQPCSDFCLRGSVRRYLKPRPCLWFHWLLASICNQSPSSVRWKAARVIKLLRAQLLALQSHGCGTGSASGFLTWVQEDKLWGKWLLWQFFSGLWSRWQQVGCAQGWGLRLEGLELNGREWSWAQRVWAAAVSVSEPRDGRSSSSSPGVSINKH